MRQACSAKGPAPSKVTGIPGYLFSLWGEMLSLFYEQRIFSRIKHHESARISVKKAIL